MKYKGHQIKIVEANWYGGEPLVLFGRECAQNISFSTLTNDVKSDLKGYCFLHVLTEVDKEQSLQNLPDCFHIRTEIFKRKAIPLGLWARAMERCNLSVEYKVYRRSYRLE